MPDHLPRFECFVYHLNVMQADLSNCEHCSGFNKVVKHKLAGGKCCRYDNVVLNEQNIT